MSDKPEITEEMLDALSRELDKFAVDPVPCLACEELLFVLNPDGSPVICPECTKEQQ